MKPRLLFIKHKDFNARTVDNDIKILSEKFTVTIQNVNTTKSIEFFYSLFKQFVWIAFNIRKFKLIYIWFADYHSVLPIFFSMIFRKISVLNIGGYDADEILISKPSNLKEKFRKFCVKYSMKHCTRMFPVSGVIKNYLNKYGFGNKSEVIYCCVDDRIFPTETIPVKENIIITIGGGGKFIKEALRKRLDLFIQIGEEFNRKFPEYNARFFLIGHDPGSNTYEYLSKIITDKNVQLKPFTRTPQELIEYLRPASVYMQLSYYEAFGIAQIEAMMYGAIPLSNPGGAIAEVVGDSGFLVKDYNIDEYIRLLKEILDGKHEILRNKARQKVISNFTIDVRRNKLLNTINELL